MVRVFFLTHEWLALKRFLRREVKFPEGMPSVYLPWLRYKKRGYEVDICILGDFEKPDLLDFEGCTIHLIPRPRFFQNWRWKFPLSRLYYLANSITMYLAVASIVRDQGRPDIIYIYQLRLVRVGWLLAKRYRALFIKRIFGTYAYSYWYNSKGLRIKCNCLITFLKWLWPSDMSIISNDGTHGDRIARLLRIPKSKFRFWLNGVDMERLSSGEQISLALRSSSGFSKEHFILMCLSRLAAWKRQDRVICAMPLILKEIPNARLLIIGDGPKRQELKKMVQELGLGAYVKFMGMIEHNKVHNVMACADVFLQTNDMSCLGNTLLEAIACGRVVVAWDVGGTRDVLIDGENGCLMPSAEPETIARTVINLAKNPERRQRLAEGARIFAKEKLQSWDERLDMEIDLIKRIKAKHRRFSRQEEVAKASNAVRK